jgi:hypothetical protein
LAIPQYTHHRINRCDCFLILIFLLTFDIKLRRKYKSTAPITVKPMISPKCSLPDSNSSTPSATAIRIGPVKSGVFMTESDLFRVMTVRIFYLMNRGLMPRSE